MRESKNIFERECDKCENCHVPRRERVKGEASTYRLMVGKKMKRSMVKIHDPINWVFIQID